MLMRRHWISFASTGDPNGSMNDKTHEWMPYEVSTGYQALVLGVTGDSAIDGGSQSAPQKEGQKQAWAGATVHTFMAPSTTREDNVCSFWREVHLQRTEATATSPEPDATSAVSIDPLSAKQAGRIPPPLHVTLGVHVEHQTSSDERDLYLAAAVLWSWMYRTLSSQRIAPELSLLVACLCVHSAL